MLRYNRANSQTNRQQQGIKRLLVMLVTLLIICPASAQRLTPRQLTQQQSQQLADQLLKLHNQARRIGIRCEGQQFPKAGKLKLNNSLTKASANHSQAMHKRNKLAHTVRPRVDVPARLEKVNYRWRAYAENIGRGNVSSIRIFQLWTQTKQHCVNIMNPSYTDIGVAKVGNYWTVVLAKPR